MSEDQETNKSSEEAPKTAEQDGAVKTEDAEKTPEEPPKEMKAVVLTNFGGIKSVKAQKRPEPSLGENEIIVRVKACGLNFQDLMGRQGALDGLPKTPFVLGFECAGEVEQVRENIDKVKVGDRVVVLPEYGAWAELITVPQQYVFPLPSEISFTDAVAITTNFVVAHILVFDLGSLSPGKTVLLHSAGGGVGQAVAQLCKTVDNVTVIGIASKGKHETIKDSVDHLIERGTDYSAEVRKISPEGVDIVLDCLYGEECNRGYSLLKPMGRYVLYGSANIVTGETKSLFSAARSWWQVDKVSPIKLFDENKSISGFNLRHFLHRQNGSEFISSTLQKVFDLWKEKKIKPVIDSTWALEDVPEAMQKMHDRKNIGKIVLDPSLEPKPKPATPAKGKGKSSDKEEKKKEESKEENKESPDAAKSPDAATASTPEGKEKEKEKEKEGSSS
ncbi:synaptic vesicle membrane protein VAT-1 homolog-like [Lycorma delicatula]|uniref:synaptic vesicle membrane protein VAT-1 homolog-like n=1 Tax=Lycorma delicatula TaxID=130591 RepID=UPI003F513637